MQARYSPEVAAALEAQGPLVALESTVICHGLPYPKNLETALEMEAAVREADAVPATIALLGGEIRVGLSEDELTRLAQAEGVRKCSPRDLPIAIGLGQDGATTVAATIVLAHRAGLRVMATGGIGGVHRDHPFDVSADLRELGRTPVVVVCSGAKAILDLPLTLEALETQGVPVVGFGTDDFPAFYTRSSGLPVNERCDRPEEVADIVRARDQLGLTAALLLTNPVPPEFELPPDDAEAAVRTALADAERQGIAGKDVTPFLLERVSALTGETSLRANTALLKNNARLAARVAVALPPGGLSS